MSILSETTGKAKFGQGGSSARPSAGKDLLKQAVERGHIKAALQAGQPLFWQVACLYQRAQRHRGDQVVHKGG